MAKRKLTKKKLKATPKKLSLTQVASQRFAGPQEVHMSGTARSLTPPLPPFLSPESDQLAVPAAPVPPIGPIVPVPIRSLRCGCWLIAYRPSGSPLVAFDGTLRVECHSAGRTASGDLYQRRTILLPAPPVLPPRPPMTVLLPPPSPAAGIPILARSRYRYYIRVTTLPEQFFIGNNFTLGFELYRFTAPNAWALEGARTALMTRMPAPAGFPSASDYAEGDVRNAAGTVVARLTMGWLSKYFRKATVEIDTVKGSEQPTTSGVGHNWTTVGDSVGWELKVVLSDTDVAEPSGASWSNAEMHAAMLARRAATNLDTEWRYHVLAVKNIDATPRGIMYDSGGTDSNNVPREGIGIASHWTIAAGWGTVSGMRFGTAAAPYFRTAVHEVGHAMGLYHNTADFGFMCTSDVIAAGATPANPFPGNISWAYHADNLKQLRHYPDPFVRPGSVAFGGASNATPPITPTDLEMELDGLLLEVTPLLAEVPIGAPVRVNYRLVNNTDQPIAVPQDLSLFGEAVSGEVTDPSGTVRTFSTVVRCVDAHEFVMLDKGESATESVTLMRGAEGALFSQAGLHEVTVDVHWEAGGMVVTARGRASVMITPAQNAGHAAAAHRVLSTPDAHLVLAIGGDHLEDGVKAIQAALDSPVLRPHFAVVEAKRIGRRFGKRQADVKAAAALLDADTVMSPSEIGRIASIAGGDGGTAGKDLGKMLKAKAKGQAMSKAAKAALDEL